MDIGTQRYFDQQNTKRAVERGLTEGLIYPCERCAISLVINPLASDKYFEGRDSEQEKWEDQVKRIGRIGRDSVYYIAWGLERSVVVCGKCSDEIENWSDSKVQEEAANWPIG